MFDYMYISVVVVGHVHKEVHNVVFFFLGLYNKISDFECKCAKYDN